MQTYKITSPVFSAAVIVGGDVVLQGPPVLDWAVGQSFPTLRDYCQKRGWIVEPLIENAHPSWLEIDGCVYEITWNEETISRITLHEGGEEPRELTWDELPDVLKEQL